MREKIENGETSQPSLASSAQADRPSCASEIRPDPVGLDVPLCRSTRHWREGKWRIPADTSIYSPSVVYPLSVIRPPIVLHGQGDSALTISKPIAFLTLDRVLLAVALLGLLGGGIAWGLSLPEVAAWFWRCGTENVS